MVLLRNWLVNIHFRLKELKGHRPTNFAEIINQDVRCVRYEYGKGLVSENYAPICPPHPRSGSRVRGDK